MRPVAPHVRLLTALLAALAACSDEPLAPPRDVATPTLDAVVHDGSAHDASTTSDAISDGVGDGSEVASALRVVVGPEDRGASLLEAIRAARRSVHMTMYLLSSRDVIRELSQARARGVEVQVVLNRTAPRGSPANTPAFEALTAAGVSVHWAPSTFAFTHAKTMIIDGAEAWIMTMNATGAGLTTNRELLMVDRDRDDVRDAEAIFRADYNGARLGRYDGGLLLSPVNAHAMILSLVNRATRSIDIETESFEDRMTAAAIAARARAGVAVRIVLPDATPTASSMRSIADVMAAGVRVVRVRAPYIHAKAVVVDGTRAYVGSANLTYVALTANRELGVIFDGPREVHQVADVIANDFAAGRPF